MKQPIFYFAWIVLHVLLLQAEPAVHEDNIVTGRITPDSDIDLEIKTERMDKWVKKQTNDDEIETIRPGVLLKNRDFLTRYENYQGFLLMYGQHVKDWRRFKVLAVERFPFSLEAKGSFSFQGTAFDNKYDRLRNRKNSSVKGYPYRGYVFFILDDLGRVVWSRASISHFTEHPGFFMSLKVKKGFNRACEKANLLK